MGIEQRLQAAHAFDPARFVPFRCDDVALGWVRRDFVGHLARFADVLRCGTDAIELLPRHDSFEARSATMAHVAKSLAERGLLTRWRNESYRIGDPAAPMFEIERAAVRFFGFAARAVHLNGLVTRAGEPCMWIARRSADKPIDPGLFDNLTGGGIGGGLDVAQTLVKECWEEAGIPRAIASRAVPAGAIEVRREVPDGLHSETLHMYDLDLPADFEPVNQDGEVAGFRCLKLRDVAAELGSDAPYTVDAGLVAIDCLRRRGVLA